MAKMDDRMQMIGSAILLQAEQESRELIAKANNIRDKEIHDYEDEIIQSMFETVQKQASALRLEAVKSVAAQQVKAHETLLKRRDELVRTVFAGVRAKLSAYVSTEEYCDRLLASLAALKERWDHSESVVYIRPDDMDLAPEIEKSLPGCKVQADPAIKTGGWRLLVGTAGILVDETLDTRLRDQRPWFLEHSGLSIK